MNAAMCVDQRVANRPKPRRRPAPIVIVWRCSITLVTVALLGGVFVNAAIGAVDNISGICNGRLVEGVVRDDGQNVSTQPLQIAIEQVYADNHIGFDKSGDWRAPENDAVKRNHLPSMNAPVPVGTSLLVRACPPA